MANHKSAKKRARQTVARTIRTRGIRTQVKSTIRAFREALTSGDKKKAEATLDIATRSLRRAASRGVLHSRTASRRVSRLARAFRANG